ncbi:HAMP domain-containing histidine kinase [Aliikangiella marina]|uniref:histidine kinase n=1 Tax=Aliikangiella marina TaxID=1712262 RepID=A0A545T578_9GAMM|nr:HAMP domain-containing sensor histidine kinase [Aliikangiella marina]TQV72391.1 HAMP domain-containing histidine kinase [Aliikangiella marina]
MNNKIKQPLKKRVFVLFGGFTVCLSVFYLGVILMTAYIVEDDIMARLLMNERAYITEHYNNSGKLITTRTDNIRVYWQEDGDYQELPSEIKKIVQQYPSSDEIFTPNDKTHFHLLPIYLEENIRGLLVGNVTPFLVVTTMSKKMLILSLFLVIFCLGLSLLLAYRLSIFIVAPIERFSRELNQNTEREEQLPEAKIQFTASTLDNEIGYLSRSLENAINRVNESYLREYHFTRDLGHELRTPLTIIKNQITLIKMENNPITSNQNESINLLEAEIEKIKQTIDVLIALAREDSINTEAVSLRAMFEEVVITTLTVYPDFIVEMKIDEGTKVVTNKQLMLLMLTNLLENAARYSHNQTLSVEFKSGKLIFENPISKETKQKSLNTHTSLGQGLFIVARICEKQGWQLSNHFSEDYFKVCIKGLA